MTKPLTIATLIFDRVEELDFLGPWEVFGCVNCVTPGPDPVVTLFTVAKQTQPLRAAHGLQIVPDYSFADCPAADIVVIPGGSGARALTGDETVLEWIRQRGASSQVILSVCTGSFLMAAAGLLEGIASTTHWSCIERMREQFPALTIIEGHRFIDNGRIVTAAGVSSGIDASLHLVKRFFGEDRARATSRYIEYESRPVFAVSQG